MPVNSKTLRQLGLGAVINAVADGAIEVYWERTPEIQNTGTFPFIRPLPFLPPVDDWFIAGVPLAVWLYSRKRGKESTRNTALGAAIYGGAMFIHHMIYWINNDLRYGFDNLIPPGTLSKPAAKSGVNLKGALPSQPKPLNGPILII